MDNLVPGIILNISAIDSIMIIQKEKDLLEIGKVLVLNISAELKCIVLVMNVLSAILNSGYRKILNNTLVKLLDKAIGAHLIMNNGMKSMKLNLVSMNLYPLNLYSDNNLKIYIPNNLSHMFKLIIIIFKLNIP